MTQANPEKDWFGEKPVTPDEKTGLVRGVFDSVADNYDVMNDLMSGGIHRLWKARLTNMIRPRAGLNYLDVAGGTGDIAFRIQQKIDQRNTKGAETPNITICDLNEQMLRVGRDRAIDKGWLNRYDWVTGNAETLPLPDSCMDVYTIAFGMRNVTRIDTALEEVMRVLKPGGRFFCLEFSHVKDPLLSKAYDIFSYSIIPNIGRLVAKDRDSYQYLVESIRKFPTQDEFATRMGNVGMKNVSYTNLSAGIAAIHYGTKP